MIFNINSTRGQTRFLTCKVRNSVQCSTKTCAQLRCFENGNDDFGVEAFWIGDAARVGYFVPLNGPLNGHPPSLFVYFCMGSLKRPHFPNDTETRPIGLHTVKSYTLWSKNGQK